jgi:transcriptional regulator with XRE-family HTH domain
LRVKLKEWMELRGVSQAQIAQALNKSRATVSAWVEGKVREGRRVTVFPDDESLDALCAFFECTPGDLLETQGTDTPTGKTWRDFRDLAAA